jgi:hypothetical protein
MNLTSRTWGALFAIGMAGWPTLAYGQQATVRGSVIDAAGGGLAGVTVTARHEDTGNTFTAVSDDRGAFRLFVRPGTIRIIAERTGLATADQRLDILMGRTASVTLRLLTPAEAGLGMARGISTASEVAGPSVSGNIDPRQMQELPLNGRNWMALTLLTPGSRLNAPGDTPVVAELPTGPFQINVDGQQVTQTLNFPTVGQPHFSRDAVAEFELLSGFDATQGRSSGVQVNVITKSGTNGLSGAVSSYVRDDRLNAADPVVGIVLPYSNRQLSIGVGGPIRRDRVHAFGSYEREREPQTFVYTTPYPRFNRSLTGTRAEDKALARLDVQFTSSTRLSARGARYINRQPYDPSTTGGSTRTPASATGLDLAHESVAVTLQHGLGRRALGEIRVGHDYFRRNSYPQVHNPHALPGMNLGKGAPQISLRGLTVGQVVPGPVDQLHDGWFVRDDILFSFGKGGRHDMKVGGEYLFTLHAATNCVACNGIFDATAGPVPANLENLFPDITDVSTWNLEPLSPIIRSYQRSIVSDVASASRPAGGSGFRDYAPRHVYAGWLQDDWAIAPRLALKLGLRYDLAAGLFANWVTSPPFLQAGRPNDTNNVAPRAGFAFSLTDRTAIRGGYGLYFSDISGGPALNTIRFVQRVQPLVLNDFRPDFATNPFKGPAPTFAEAARLLCAVTPGPLCLRPSLQSQIAPDVRVSYAHQASIGVVRSLTDRLSVQVDYSFTADRATWLNGRNANLSYDPSTGANYPLTDVARRPYPDWGTVFTNRSDGRTTSHSLQATATKRFSHGWQASGTYALDGSWIFDTLPLNPGCAYPVTLTAAGQPVCDVPIRLALDVSQNKYYLSGAQRQRLSANGIWEISHGFELSGVYLFGDQGKATPTSGVDVRQTGSGSGRLRSNGTVIARNSFDLPSIHRLDLRILRRFRVARARIDGMLEIFNVFNRANYGSFVLNESNSNYGRPSAGNPNLAYAARMLQVGLRATF